MSTARWFDTDAEIEQLRSTPAKAAKVAKAETEDEVNFSRISNFSRGAGSKTCFLYRLTRGPSPRHPTGSTPNTGGTRPGPVDLSLLQPPFRD